MKVCCDCGIVETPLGGKCDSCRREYQRRYREQRKKTHPDYFKEYYAKHREKKKEQARDYWRARPEENRQRVKAWRAANPEQARETRRRYVLAHPEFVKRWTSWANWRRRSNPPSAEAMDWSEILHQDRCCYCDAPTEHIDHIDAVAHHGTNAWSNLTSSCQRCNRQKSDRLLLTFLAD